MCLGWALCLNFWLNDGHVLSYGRSKTLAQLMKGNQEKIHVYRNKHFNLNQLSCKKALVKELGSTRREKFTINHNEIIFMGNRNLVMINGKLYICT